MDIATQAERAMEEARAGLVSTHPSLGFLSFKLNWFADPTCDTAWVDGVNVGFNPEFIMGCTKGQRKFVAAHEVGHPMLGHHLRRGDRDPELWNQACDYVLNWMLKDGNFDMLEGVLLDRKFALMAVEEAYSHLEAKRQEEDKGGEKGDSSGQDDGSSESSDGGDSGQDGPSDGTPGPGGESDSEPGESQDNREPGESQPGSESGEAGSQDDSDGDESGGKGKASQPDNSSGGPGKSDDGKQDSGQDWDGVRDFPGDSGEATEEEIDAEAEKWDIATQQAAQIARKLQGEVPGFVETLLTDISDPKLPWAEILARWVSQKVKDDYNFSKPNPRYSSTGFFMPALESLDIGKVAIFWDTSCSVTDSQVADIAAETQGLLEAHPGVKIDLYHIDTDVRHIEELDQYTDWDKISAKGRGGTDFRPGFYAVEDSEEEDPVGIIYMTDGECDKFPETPPNIPVLWIIVDMPHYKRFEPPFGEVAYYDDFDF